MSWIQLSNGRHAFALADDIAGAMLLRIEEIERTATA